MGRIAGTGIPAVKQRVLDRIAGPAFCEMLAKRMSSVGWGKRLALSAPVAPHREAAEGARDDRTLVIAPTQAATSIVRVRMIGSGSLFAAHPAH
jgi:hypothetical protein